MFKVGDKVEWESQAGGNYRTKKGEVFDVINGYEAPAPGDYHFHKTMFDGDGSPRGHESYLVEVPGGKTPKAKPRLYWPRVSQLRKIT